MHLQRSSEDDLAQALAMVDRASRLAMEHFRRGVTATSKADGSPVSEADRAVERLLREAIGERWPGDAIVGEELGHRFYRIDASIEEVPRIRPSVRQVISPPSPHRGGEITHRYDGFVALGDALGSERTWIIDPIDGTSSFIKGNPDWRVHLALEIQGQIVVGVVAAPAMGVWWWARRGGSSFESGWPDEGARGVRRLSVSATKEPRHSRVQGYPLDEVQRRLVGWDVLALSSVVPLEVMRGALDAVIFQGCHAWDHAPWILLVQESGGCFTDWNGGSSAHTGGGLFSNAQLHPALVLALGMGLP